MSFNKNHPLGNKNHSEKFRRKRKRPEDEKQYLDTRKIIRSVDRSDSEDYDSDNCMPAVYSMESSIGKRCNFKCYSNYSTSKNLHTCNQSRNKCVRIISIDKYLQGKVSAFKSIKNISLSRRTPYSLHSISSSISQCAVNVNTVNVNTVNPIVVKCKPVTENVNLAGKFSSDLSGCFGKALHICKAQGVVKTRKYSTVNMLAKTLPSFFETEINCKKVENLDAFIGVSSFAISRKIDLLRENKILSFYSNITFSILSSIKSEELNFIRNYPNLYSSDISEEETLFQSSSTTSFFDSASSSTDSKMQTAGNSEQNVKVIQTLVDLFQLSSKIDEYKSILEENDFKVTNSFDEFGEICMKEKTANLVMRFNNMLAKKHKSKPMTDKNITVYNLRSKKSRTNNSLEYLNIEKSFIRFNSSGRHCGKLSESEYVEMMASQSANDDLQPPKRRKASTRKRKCKRKRNTEGTSKRQATKRSKTLDECIERASTTDIYDLGFKLQDLSIQSENEERYNNENDCIDTAYMNEDLAFLTLPFMSSCTSRTYTTEEEINRILSLLPPLEETLNTSHVQEQNEPDFGDPTDIIHYEISEGNFMVIFPYVDLDI